MTTMTTTVDRAVLVDPDWLAEHLSDPKVRVVEVDVSPAAYNDWHIDGAVLWNIYTDLKEPDYQLVGRSELEVLLARSGITPESTVVFYGYGPALGLWLMKLYGHADVRILDCSRETWRSAHPAFSTSAGPQRTATGPYQLGAEDPRVRADRVAVHAAITDPTREPRRCPFSSGVHRRAVLALRRAGARRASRARPDRGSPASRGPLRRAGRLPSAGGTAPPAGCLRPRR